MIQSDHPPRLEDALARTESDVDALLKACASLTASLKKLRAAAAVGNLRELRPTLALAEASLANVRQQFANARDGWDFEEEGYLASGSYVAELLETAEGARLRIFERDERLYCYPVLVRLLPGERVVQIDKARERKLRPSVLVNHLRDLQRRPPKFRPEAFLEALFSGYTHLVRQRGKQLSNVAPVEQLARIYELLTMLPGQSREYSPQEYARDIYLLDRSGVTVTRHGYVVSFPASTGTRSASRIIRATGEDGQERIYYGIAFAAVDSETAP